MSTTYYNHGTDWYLFSDKEVVLHKRLPAANYIIKEGQRGLYLEESSVFTLPGKLYGDIKQRAARIMQTFDDRAKDGKATGVLLAGEKGSGKTLLAKYLSKLGSETGLPTILVNQPWSGDGFNQLITGIEQPAILLFDEFEKVYGDNKKDENRPRAAGEDSPPSQSDLLTLMDGVFPTPKLFILTCNEKSKIDKRMINRPGRLYYSLEYTGLSAEMVNEYGEDRLENKSHLKELASISTMFDTLSFDMLQAVVEECNRYGEGPLKAIEMLNVRPEFEGRSTYTAKLLKRGERIILDADNYDSRGGFIGSEVYVQPFKSFSLYYKGPKGTAKSAGDDRVRVNFSAEYMVEADAQIGRYVYRMDDYELTLLRYVPKIPKWEKLFAA